MDKALDQSQTNEAASEGEERSRYTLVRLLGKGGAGEVHEGYVNQPDGSQRRVAVKILHDNPSDEVGRLRRLVEVTSRFDHPNVAASFEFVASSAGRVLLSDYVDGMTVVE